MYGYDCFSHAFFALESKLEGEVVHVILIAGDVIFLPSAMIHFVYTPKESVAMGVNFLNKHTLLRSIAMHQRETEKRAHSFPHFPQVLTVFCAHQYLAKDIQLIGLPGWTPALLGAIMNIDDAQKAKLLAFVSST